MGSDNILIDYWGNPKRMMVMTDKPANKEMLSKEGLKNTRKRHMILDILRNAEKPLTADEIFLMLKEEHISIWISTVYRTLEILSSKGLANKTNLQNSSRYSYELNRMEHKHYLICMDCNKMVTIEECPFEDFAKDLGKKTYFEVTGHKLELYGYCSVCKEKL